MSQKKPTVSENIAAVETAGRELMDSALQRHPVITLASSVLEPIVNAFRGRRPKTPASVRKMKLESYSYSPVRKRSSRGSLSRSTAATPVKGGSHHG